MTDDAELIERLREQAWALHKREHETLGQGEHARKIEDTYYWQAADRLASLIANQELNLQVCRDLINERDAVREENEKLRVTLQSIEKWNNGECGCGEQARAALAEPKL